MKLRIAWLAILCLALAAIPAWAQRCSYYSYWCYDNGPINGNTDAWTINDGYIVSDTFTAGYARYGPDQVSGFSFGVWELSGDTMTSVDWSITSGENSGMTFGSGTATKSGGTLTDAFISTNWYGFDIDLIAVSGLSVNVTGGTTYWLNLQNAVVTNGDLVYWDENSGAFCGGLNGTGQGCPSQASENTIGTIAGEAFTVQGALYSPEPSSIVLFGSGILGVAGVLRRKLF